MEKQLKMRIGGPSLGQHLTKFLLQVLEILHDREIRVLSESSTPRALSGHATAAEAESKQKWWWQ